MTPYWEGDDANYENWDTLDVAQNSKILPDRKF